MLQTQRLIITHFTPDMARDVHLNSLDEDNRRFVPDEVFETEEDAAETLSFLIEAYETGKGPLVYPILLQDYSNIGYVQVVPTENSQWEIGYHIAKAHTGKGYATEAIHAFLPFIMEKLHLKSVQGVCLADNFASRKVLEHCGFYKAFDGFGPYQGDTKHICIYIFPHNA